MSALWLYVRSSIARWGFIPLTVLGIAVLFGRSRYWLGIWPETGVAAQVSALFLSVFGAGTAAWIVAQVQVRGLHEQEASAAIRSFTIEGTRFAAMLLWLLAPYLVVAAVAFVATTVTLIPPGIGSFFRYILLGAVMIVFGTAWGWLVGRLLAPLVAAVCAALSWFIVASLLGDATEAALLSGPPWLEVRVDAVGLRLAAVLIFAAAVCAIPWEGGVAGSGDGSSWR